MKIGLEVHVQLLTKTKLFCGCLNQAGAEPNTLTCETCIGLPGSKPRLNAKAVEYGMKIALALSCRLPKSTYFSRKSYFYPDMSKNFQITQYEVPLAKNGFMKTNAGKGRKIRIERINLEEDPARIVHAGTITTADYMLVDYNRSGVPLCEIVTAPDFSSSKEARIFLQELSTTLQYLKVFDPDIEGSMRVDANISLGQTGSRVEIKNITGFKDVEKALNYEAVRQRTLLRQKKKIARETRSWDAATGTTKALRAKEEEEDYGYIFEPDLVRITLAAEKLRKIKASLPEFSHQRIKRYAGMGIEKELAVAIASEPDIAVMFEEAVKYTDAKLAARWFAGEIKKTLNYSNLRIGKIGLEPGYIIKLLQMVERKKLTERSAELILREILLHPADPEKLAAKATRIYDEKLLEDVVRQAMAENVMAVVEYNAGKNEAFHFLVGQAMRKTQGRGDPETIRKLLKKLL